MTFLFATGMLVLFAMGAGAQPIRQDYLACISKAEQGASFMIVRPDEYRSIVDQLLKCMAVGA